MGIGKALLENDVEEAGSGGVRLCPLVLTDLLYQTLTTGKRGDSRNDNWQEKTKVLGERKPALMPLRPPQIPHVTSNGRNQISAVRTPRSTA